MLIKGWSRRGPERGLVPVETELGALEPDSTLIEVAGCAACEVDARTGRGDGDSLHPLPLGHEIAGKVVGAGDAAKAWIGQSVVVPVRTAFQSCHECGASSPRQPFPQLPVPEQIGGFASHVAVPARGLCSVEESDLTARNLQLSDLSVLAEAITTPYEAIVRSRLREGDVAVFVGAGACGSFGAQIATTLGARVVALDCSEDSLHRLSGLADVALDHQQQPVSRIRAAIAEATGRDAGWKVYETTGTARGQELACGLLTHGGFLSVVGYPKEKASISLQDIVGYVATVQGTCNCADDALLPEALELVLAGDVEIDPFVVRRPMSAVNDVLEELEHQHLNQRAILVPDFR